ncbi:MAG: hypothetical protein HIU93_15985 [Acidobacteria bacterium]|nr:hypothetical protein [Acidobacteriota bacterium]
MSDGRGGKSQDASDLQAGYAHDLYKTGPMPDTYEPDIYEAAEWRLACRVAASTRLSKSALLPKFLLYVCEQSLKGKAHQLNEQRIGTSIFNRSPEYNPGEDNIVRSYARTLRRRLDEYFEGEGKDEPVRIVIARGGYVPTFQANRPKDLAEAVLQTSPEAESETMPVVEAVDFAAETGEREVEGKLKPGTRIKFGTGSDIGLAPRLWLRFRSRWVLPLCTFLAGLCVAWLWFSPDQSQERRTQSQSHLIWAQMFQPSRNTLIVPADSGLGILQNLSGHLISLEEYTNGSYFSDKSELQGVAAASLADLRQQRYTSLVDLSITNRLTQLPEYLPARTEIRFARSITTDDLKTSNVILLGSTHSNPWVTLFQDKLNFRLQYKPEVNQSFVVNERPVGSEQKEYFNGTGADANQTYSVIDYLPNLEGNGHVLIIQGLNMAATQAAADALFNSDTMKPILEQAIRADRSLRPFELLIKTRSVGAAASDLQVIAVRIHA